jgi:hypothetical protein
MWACLVWFRLSSHSATHWVMRLHLHIRYRGGVAVALPNWGRLPRIWTVPGKLMRFRSSYVGSFTYLCLAASFFPSLSVRISVLRGRKLLTTALQNSSALSILEEKPMEIYCLNLSETLFRLLPLQLTNMINHSVEVHCLVFSQTSKKKKKKKEKEKGKRQSYDGIPLSQPFRDI